MSKLCSLSTLPCFDEYIHQHNAAQKQAVQTLNGPVLILVGDKTGEISGKYSRDKLQPYIGIGYTDTPVRRLPALLLH